MKREVEMLKMQIFFEFWGCIWEQNETMEVVAVRKNCSAAKKDKS